MGVKKVRILMAKFGEGHEASLMKLATAFSEAGFEVIYTMLQDPEAIVTSALQESVDHIGITTLSGTQVKDFTNIFDLLAKEKMSHIGVTAGGFLHDEDIERIKEMGVIEFFPVGTTYGELIEWSRKHIRHTE